MGDERVPPGTTEPPADEHVEPEEITAMQDDERAARAQEDGGSANAD